MTNYTGVNGDRDEESWKDDPNYVLNDEEEKIDLLAFRADEYAPAYRNQASSELKRKQEAGKMLHQLYKDFQ